MVEFKKLEYLKDLSIKDLKAKIREIKAQLPQDERNIITYSRNFTISLSNYCQNQCGYCFYNFKIPKINGKDNVILINNEEIIDLVQKAIQYNCKEALLMSGERPESFQEVKAELERRDCSDFIQLVIDICTYLLDLNLLPHTNLGELTYDELKRLKEYNASMGLMLESTSKHLFDKGGVHEFSPGKQPEKRIRHIEDAGKLKIPFTTGLLLGIGESFKDRIKDLYLIKDIHNQYGHIQEVIIQNFIYKDGIPYHPKNPITIEDIVKIAGIARIIFENDIHIQIPPNLIAGYEKEFLKIGIDDFGGISPITKDFINPKKPWPQIEYLEKVCKVNGYTLKERFPIYDKFINKTEFISNKVKKIIDKIILNDNRTGF